ncbi:hypothetical protein MNBD_GAMMA16-739 [hydrothermal vent metagenome]|uniref:YtkA-like domain-containing protein n=1 Tax=hydrothermal vent metagenome TaxID=652676 RepID=A0A3B0Z4Z6_9ZZZZ
MTKIILLLLAVSLIACDLGLFTQTQETDEYFISITHDPHPLIVGESAKIYATLRKERNGIPACDIKFQQYSKVSSSEAVVDWLEMKERGPAGTYHGRTNVFDVRGDWMLEFKVKCRRGEKTFKFPYNVGDVT